MRSATLAAALAAGSATLLALMAKGKLTLDLGWGRTLHPLGPIELKIDAPRPLVFEQLSAPYLGRIPRALQDSLQVLERSEHVVVARHTSDVKLLGPATYKAETVETVQFDKPFRISFRHLRGPVPHAVEEFRLVDLGGSTLLVYEGELGIDFWALGALAGKYWVTPEWLDTVRSHMTEVKTGAERRADAQRRRADRQVSQ